MNSILQNNLDECWHCGTTGYLDEHHIFSGCRRQKSEQYGLKVMLCRRCHSNLHMHPNSGLDKQLKTIAQQAFEDSHDGSTDYFCKEFGKSFK